MDVFGVVAVDDVEALDAVAKHLSFISTFRQTLINFRYLALLHEFLML
jgi:hypothetical protein